MAAIDAGQGLRPHVGQMKWVWMGVFAVVALFAGGMTKWEVIAHLVDNQGVGEEGAGMLAFLAGYTLPFFLATTVVALVYLREGEVSLWVVIVVFIVAGHVASLLGLGLLAEYDYTPPDVPIPGVSILLRILGGYLDTYGWPLMVSSLAVGIGAALHIDAAIRHFGRD